jgi:protoporphyrinogen oxidase
MDEAIEWLESSMGVFAQGRVHPFSSPIDLLRFSPLSLPNRMRMGLRVLGLNRADDQARFERETARAWIEREMGRQAWETVWGPLLRGKFGQRADDISMAWLWSKIRVRRQVSGKEARRELLGYPRGSWQPLLDRLAAEIANGGGRVLIDRPAALIARTAGGFEVTPGAADSFRRGHDPTTFDRETPQEYDAVLATVPSDVFRALLDPALAADLGSGYLAKLDAVEYQTALCLLLEIDRQFSPIYWINIADTSLPFVGLIEQTNLLEPARYGGRHLLYVANYVAPGDPLLGLDPDALLETYEPGLRAVSPGFSAQRVKARWVFAEPAAQPTVTLGYHERIPAMKTPVPGLVLANTTQIYPEDRGTNYSVRLGDDAAAELLAGLTARSGGPLGAGDEH